MRRICINICEIHFCGIYALDEKYEKYSDDKIFGAEMRRRKLSCTFFWGGIFIMKSFRVAGPEEVGN